MTKHEGAGGVPPYIHIVGQEKRKLSRPGGAYLQVLTRPRRPKGEVTTARKIDVSTLPLSPLLPWVFPCRPRPTSMTSSLSSPRPAPTPNPSCILFVPNFASPPPLPLPKTLLSYTGYRGPAHYTALQTTSLPGGVTLHTYPDVPSRIFDSLRRANGLTGTNGLFWGRRSLSTCVD